MSTSLTTAPPALRNHPVFQKVVGQLTTTRAAAREARETAKTAMPPVVATGCSVIGGAGAGVLHAYLGPKTAAPATWGVGLLLTVAGAVTETPEVSQVGNGMLAAMAAQFVHRSLVAPPPTGAQSSNPPPADKPAEKPAA